MAKIYHSHYDRMLHEKGLLQAFRKVKSNKRKPGIDGQSIEDFCRTFARRGRPACPRFAGEELSPPACQTG